MKSLVVSAFLLLGTVCASPAQVSRTNPLPDTDNPAPDFSATSAGKATLPDFLAAADSFAEPRADSSFSAPGLSTALVAEPAPATPARPSPTPRFVYGGRDDYRWQLGVAFAHAEDLKGEFINTSSEGFRCAHDISAYSLIAVSRAAMPLMTDGGGIVTMSYYGAEKVVPKYNVMGVAKAALEACVRYLANDLGPKKIRVNAISAGPIKTLAARGISGLGDMLKAHSERAPLKRNVDPAEVGATAAFLLSDGGSGITGETIYVDCGYNVMGF